MSAAEQRGGPVGFWLVPAKQDHARLSEIVSRLARTYGAPLFEPHLTLHVGTQSADDNLHEIMRAAAATTDSFALSATSTGHSAALFKTLFVEFAHDEAPHTLQQSLAKGLKIATAYSLEPHVSLLYKELPETVRSKLADEFFFHGQSITFDEIAAVRPGPSGEFLDIEKWDVWMRMPLRSR